VPRYVIDADARTVTPVGEVPEGFSPIGGDTFEGGRFYRGPLSDAWFVIDGIYRRPMRGRVVLEVDLTRDQIVEAIDFGVEKQLGPARMFWGDRIRREIT
jgi:hypothetical protein